MNPVIENHKQQIIELCEKHHIKELYAFGSGVRGDFTDKSDVDFLYRFYENKIPEDVYAENFFSFKEGVRSVLNRKVDLVAYDFLTNPYFIKVIEKEKKKIYG